MCAGADEAYPIGQRQLLSRTSIFRNSRRRCATGADAITLATGFLSENAKLHGLRGCRREVHRPLGAAMDAMDRRRRRGRAMERAGVPIVPGTSRGLESAEQAKRLQARIGYPVCLRLQRAAAQGDASCHRAAD